VLRAVERSMNMVALPNAPSDWKLLLFWPAKLASARSGGLNSRSVACSNHSRVARSFIT
jgi:hypothetical protein